MSVFSELYQQLILDHNRNPRNKRTIEGATCMARGHNPLCGDKVIVFVTLEDGVVRDVAFEGEGCAICTASASLMTESLKGRTEAEADALFERFHKLLTTDEDADPDALGKLAALEGVREFPVRVKCATLPWHTFHAAVKPQEPESVTTE